MFLKGGQDPNSNQYQEIGRLLSRAAMTREEQKKKKRPATDSCITESIR